MNLKARYNVRGSKQVQDKTSGINIIVVRHKNINKSK